MTRQLIRKLSGPEKTVLSILLAFYSGILVGFVFEVMAISLEIGRALASPIVGTC